VLDIPTLTDSMTDANETKGKSEEEEVFTTPDNKQKKKTKKDKTGAKTKAVDVANVLVKVGKKLLK